MSRTHRLLTLMQLFHDNQFAITAEDLASKLDVSVRTVYRDIETVNTPNLKQH